MFNGACLHVPDVSNLRSVLEEPAIRNLVLPADIPGVLPQKTHLIRCVSRVPQGVPHVLTGTCFRLHHLLLKSGIGLRRRLSYRGKQTLPTHKPSAVFLAQRQLGTAQPANTSVLFVSTSLHRRRTSPGSRKWNRRNHRPSLCLRGMFPQNQLHWRLYNLEMHTGDTQQHGSEDSWGRWEIAVVILKHSWQNKDTQVFTNSKAWIRVHGLYYFHTLKKETK